MAKALPRESANVLSVSCNICGSRPDKIVDAPTVPHGQWAHLCETCYQKYASQAAHLMGTTHRNIA